MSLTFCLHKWVCFNSRLPETTAAFLFLEDKLRAFKRWKMFWFVVKKTKMIVSQPGWSSLKKTQKNSSSSSAADYLSHTWHQKKKEKRKRGLVDKSADTPRVWLLCVCSRLIWARLITAAVKLPRQITEEATPQRESSEERHKKNEKHQLTCQGKSCSPKYSNTHTHTHTHQGKKQQ